jgi:AcrR family transcriptional regulator
MRRKVHIRGGAYCLGAMATRSETSRRAILEATSDLLDETTVQKLSIEAIAKRAGVGKTTIYRWWPSKAAVVIDAFVEYHLVHTPIRDDVPVRQAMTEHLASLVEQYAGPRGRLVAQIIAEMQYDESTLREFRERFWDGRRAATRALVERGVREGDLRDDLDPELMVEIIYSAVYIRLLFHYRTLDRTFAEAIIAAAFAGIAAPRPVET